MSAAQAFSNTKMTVSKRLVSRIVDLHVHSAPSLLPRHHNDEMTVTEAQRAGVEISVLKAHEGSTAERAALCGSKARGGVVLNSPVGGANPDAVEVAAKLGGRVVWMPTLSAITHQQASASPDLSMHRSVFFKPVPAVEEGRLRTEWIDVLDVVASFDLVLASGHLSTAEALILFKVAKSRGVQRFLLNHPCLPFIGWSDALTPSLRTLGVHLEIGILPDLLVPKGQTKSVDLVDLYPTDLLVFGADLGHSDYPRLIQVLPTWQEELIDRVGESVAIKIMSDNGRRLIER